MSTTTTTTTTERLTDLQRERQALAYAAQTGDVHAAERLDAVEAEILRIERDTERAALAARERERRETEQQAEAERQRIAALEARARTLAVEQLAAAREVDVAADVLADRVAKLMAVGNDLYRVRMTLRPSAALYRLPGLVLDSLRWRLSPMLVDIGRAAHQSRKPLVDLLGGGTPEAES